MLLPVECHIQKDSVNLRHTFTFNTPANTVAPSFPISLLESTNVVRHEFPFRASAIAEVSLYPILLMESVSELTFTFNA
jgi:hypothetical protein